MKRRVALLFGGRSLESDISIITALQTLGNIDKSQYLVEPIYMYDGEFYVNNVDEIEDFIDFDVNKHNKLILHKGGFYKIKRGKLSKYFKPDCALICCHGGEGEGGVLQGVLEYNNIPYTSSSLMQSAIGMDKTMLKRLFENMLLNVLPYSIVYKCEYDYDRDALLNSIEKRLNYPLIVKPSRLGSSIGIDVANDRHDLEGVIDVALSFDDVVIVEEKLVDFVEVNCSAYKKGGDIIVSSTEEPIFDNDYLSFNDKYMSEGKISGGGHVIPARIGELNEVVRKQTRRIYKELDLFGVVRVDYLVDMSRNKVYVNEVNTIPGSMAFYLYEGISFANLISDLIEEGISRKINNCTVFKSNVLSHFVRGGKIIK